MRPKEDQYRRRFRQVYLRDEVVQIESAIVVTRSNRSFLKKTASQQSAVGLLFDPLPGCRLCSLAPGYPALKQKAMHFNTVNQRRQSGLKSGESWIGASIPLRQ